MDFSFAFLNGDLDETIYMKQPEGFVEQGPDYVCRLKKSLYGLKQSARQWNRKLHETLVKLGFSRLESDRSIYFYSRGSVKIMFPVHVDDVLLASNSESAIDSIIAELSTYFHLRDLSPSSCWIL